MPEELDADKVRHMYNHIAQPATFEEWYDAPAPVWDNKSAHQMVLAGRVSEVLDTLDAIASGAFL